jgi:hypothetical protein
MSKGAHHSCFALFSFFFILSIACAKAASGGVTPINPISSQIMPDPAARDQPAAFYIETDSGVDLNSAICEAPTGAGRCTCTIGYKGSHSNFRCDALPPVFGTYSISMRDISRGRGSMAISISEPRKIEVQKDATATPKIPNGPTFGPITDEKPQEWPILALFLLAVLIIAYEFREHVMFRAD